MNKNIRLFIICIMLSTLFPMLIWGAEFYSNATQEIRLHDIYLELKPYHITIAFCGPALFLVFLIRGLSTKFKHVSSWIFFSIGALILVVIAIATCQLLYALRTL